VEVKDTKSMKIRLLLMGVVISALSAILMAARGYSGSLAGLLALGLVVLVIGVFWK
jgi:hypothetical protein